MTSNDFLNNAVPERLQFRSIFFIGCSKYSSNTIPTRAQLKEHDIAALNIFSAIWKNVRPEYFTFLTDAMPSIMLHEDLGILPNNTVSFSSSISKLDFFVFTITRIWSAKV